MKRNLPLFLLGFGLSTALGCGGTPEDVVGTDSGAGSSDSGGGRHDGSSDRPDGSFDRPDGSFDRPDGSFDRPDGSFDRPDGSFERPDVDRPDGSFDRPDGSFDHPDGSFDRPDVDRLDGGLDRPDVGRLGDGGSMLDRDGGLVIPDAAPRPDGGALNCNPALGVAEACGGDPVGQWSFVDHCPKGDLAQSLTSQCAGRVTVTRQSEQANGTLQITSAMFSIDLDLSVEAGWTIPLDPCLLPAIRSCATYASTFERALQMSAGGTGTQVSCTDVAGTCNCTLRFVRGVLSTGTYVLNNGVITTTSSTGEVNRAYYCVQGDGMQYKADQGGPTFVLER